MLTFLPSLVLRRKQSDAKKEEEKKKQVHIKKPLNAFMLYMKEMRAKVVAECTLKESAAINQILGRRVSLNSGSQCWCSDATFIRNIYTWGCKVEQPGGIEEDRSRVVAIKGHNWHSRLCFVVT